MRGNLKLLTLSIILTTLLCSCSLFPSPNDAIGPPQKNKNISAKNKDLSSIVNAFLPEGSILLEPVTKSIKPIHEVDLDKDGKNEILVSYKCDKNMIQSGFMILKIKGDVWDKAYEDNNDYLLTNDIKIFDEKNYPIVLLLRSNVSENDFKAVSWINDEFQLVLGLPRNIGLNEIEFKDLEGTFGQDGREELIVTNKYDGDSIDYAIFRPWMGCLIGTSPIEFPEYTMKKIEFYQNKLKGNPDKFDYYSNLYMSQLELEGYQDALNTLNNGLKANLSSQDKCHLMILKAQMFTKLRKPIEARKILNELLNTSKDAYFVDNIMADIFILDKKYDKAREIYQSKSEYPYPDEIKRLDEIICQDEILEYVDKNIGIANINSSNKIKELEKMGTDKGIKITPVIPKYPEKSDFKVLFIKYSINPEKVHERPDIGGSIVYWVYNGKLYHQSFINYLDGVNPFDISSAKFFVDKNSFPTISCTFNIDQEIISSMPAGPINPLSNKSIKSITFSYKLKDSKWTGIIE